ncbi:uncharacterized protein LOC111879848 isoform X2 [Lactuca sativa]|uniref:uncharacterized protein LOC111879848 isoform X2 n=1 Tax=Lactuca sativa TaxID=4236 RepID=UPI000CD9F5EF|nr:uncharacterized protein LOC111879848 isoform X2 [Lactuca sativa]
MKKSLEKDLPSLNGSSKKRQRSKSKVKEASQKRSSKKDTSDKPQRSSHRKSSEGSKICAFDLLASIADKLSQESESSTSITSPEQKDQITLSKESPHSV